MNVKNDVEEEKDKKSSSSCWLLQTKVITSTK